MTSPPSIHPATDPGDRSLRLQIVAYIMLAVFALGCADTSNPSTPPVTGTLKLAIANLGDPGIGRLYEGWVVVGGVPKSIGTFTVNTIGQLSKTEFTLSSDDLAAATTFFVTVERNPDSDPAPSAIRIVAGDFSGAKAIVNVSHPMALGASVATATGTCFLATPTDDPDMDHELSGIWFGTLVTASPSPGLSLPTLGAGWVYEGWVVIGGKALSTGRFATALRADSAALYSSTGIGFAFPGEDFLRNAPPGLIFPTNISTSRVMITVEPSPDYSADPFPIRPLSLTLPASAKVGTDYTMEIQALPEGNVTR